MKNADELTAAIATFLAQYRDWDNDEELARGIVQGVLKPAVMGEKPDPISPRVMAAREWLKADGLNPVAADRGAYDGIAAAKAFLAGFAAAVKLAEPLVKEVSRLNPKTAILQPIHDALTTYRQSIGGSHEGQ